MASSSARWSVFLPLDMPLMPSSLVAFLVSKAMEERAVVTLAQAGDYVETFPVVLERTMLPGLRRVLEAGHGGCFAAFQSVAAELCLPVHVVQVELAVSGGMVSQLDGVPAAGWFLNVNEPTDLARAEAICPDRVR